MARAQTSNRQRSNGRTDRAPQRKGGRSRGGDGRPERQADRYAKEPVKTAARRAGSYLRKMGVLPAAPDSIAAALAAGHDVALWPGGEIDSLRPWVKRDEAILAGRKGFVRTAISAGVPIVPISTVGGPDSM